MTELFTLEEKGLVEDLRLSFSRVSSFDREGAITLIKKKVVSGEGVTIGGLVDLLLYQPEIFKENYYVFKAKIPTATSKELADIIIREHGEMLSKEQVLNIVRANGFWSKIVKEDTLIKKFDNDDFWDYLKAVFESKDKTIVTLEDIELAKELVSILKNHKNSKDIVAYPEEHESKYVQVELDFTYRQFSFRGIVDEIIVDHKEKTIKFIDLKTGSKNAESFIQSFVKYRYYLQALLYLIGSKEFIKQNKLEDYKLLPFEFLYIGRYERIPFNFVVSDKWIEAAKKGFTTKGGYKYKGLDELLDEIEWHWVNKEFNLPKQLAESKGVVEINSDFIEVNE